jgi:diguanylate cyclase (GGDEF)-like protein
MPVPMPLPEDARAGAESMLHPVQTVPDDAMPVFGPAPPTPPAPAPSAMPEPQIAPPQPAFSNPSSTPAGLAPAPAAEAASWMSWGVVALILLLLSGWWAARRRGRLLAEEAEQLSRQQTRLSVAHHQLKLQSAQLREQAIQDPLTGVLNRAAFASEFRDLAERAATGGRLLNLVVFDLDHFKAINDRQGHLVGDAALKLVVGIVREHLVSADLFGRFGGDEFLIACADQPLPFCRDLAERIRTAVETRAREHRPALTGLTLSMGIAQADADSGYAADALFARADAALYEAKRQGRNRVVVADASLPQTPTSDRHL